MVCASATAVLAHIDFYQYVDGGVARLGVLHGLRQSADAFCTIYGQRQPSALGIQRLGECRHAGQLGRGDDFVADEDIGNAALSQRFGFADFLHTVADGPRVLQQMRDMCRFMQLGMRAP